MSSVEQYAVQYSLGLTFYLPFGWIHFPRPPNLAAWLAAEQHSRLYKSATVHPGIPGKPSQAPIALSINEGCPRPPKWRPRASQMMRKSNTDKWKGAQDESKASKESTAKQTQQASTASNHRNQAQTAQQASTANTASQHSKQSY